jgi:hypothetical protein
MLWFISRRRIGTTTSKNEVNSLAAISRKLLEGAPVNIIQQLLLCHRAVNING